MPTKSLLERIEILPEATVAEYLQRHPDFFTRHKNLLKTLVNPKEDTTLLLKQELEDLREKNQRLQNKLKETPPPSSLQQNLKNSHAENQKLRAKLEDLIAVAQENEKLNRRIQHLISTLINVNGIEDFFQTLYSTLCNEFETDVVVIRCFEVVHSERQEFVNFDAQTLDLFSDLLKGNKPICGKLSVEQHNYLFPDSKIVSAVLIPILANSEEQPQGLLAMGSHDETRFQADMSTDFLIYLGELVSNLLRIWI
ncbi:DUF484 family protein [Candidatus Halobeggiatoa sp. HSG11]|nr:DUF484 family protein [Candidatus Halobeggiatoa sp. HSG11]